MTKDILFYFLNNKDNKNNKNKSSGDKSCGDKSCVDKSSVDKTNKDNKKISKTVKLEAFTDGSAINNGRNNIKSGIGIYFMEDTLENVSINCSSYLKSNQQFNILKPTNNVAELLAILIAIEKMIEFSVNYLTSTTFIIYSDSEYSINSITKWCKGWKKNNWKKKGNLEIKNVEIIKTIYNYYLNYKIRFVHVNSHMPEPNPKYTPKWMIWKGNDNADKLAKLGSVS